MKRKRSDAEYLALELENAEQAKRIVALSKTIDEERLAAQADKARAKALNTGIEFSLARMEAFCESLLARPITQGDRTVLTLIDGILWPIRGAYYGRIRFPYEKKED